MTEERRPKPKKVDPKTGRYVSTLTPADVREIRRMFAAGYTTREIGEKFSIRTHSAYRIGKRLRWAHLKD